MHRFAPDARTRFGQSGPRPTRSPMLRHRAVAWKSVVRPSQAPRAGCPKLRRRRPARGVGRVRAISRRPVVLPPRYAPLSVLAWIKEERRVSARVPRPVGGRGSRSERHRRTPRKHLLAHWPQSPGRAACPPAAATTRPRGEQAPRSPLRRSPRTTRLSFYAPLVTRDRLSTSASIIRGARLTDKYQPNWNPPPSLR